MNDKVKKVLDVRKRLRIYIYKFVSQCCLVATGHLDKGVCVCKYSYQITLTDEKKSQWHGGSGVPACTSR